MQIPNTQDLAWIEVRNHERALQERRLARLARHGDDDQVETLGAGIIGGRWSLRRLLRGLTVFAGSSRSAGGAAADPV